MREFLNGQLDYIYFFSGLSFFLMAFVCFALFGKQRNFPWILLGFFGIFCGISEWLLMYTVINGTSRVVSSASLFALATSFFFLFEFSRSGVTRIKARRISHWIYAPVLALLPLGYRYGLNGWLVMVQYVMALPASYLAAAVIYKLCRERQDHPSLAAFSLLLSLYAATSLFTVPKINFFPANFLNGVSFSEALRIPIQLVRAVIALLATFTLGLYSSTVPNPEYRPQISRMHFVPTKWLVALTMLTIIGAGWFFTNYLDYYAGIRMIKKNEPRATSPLSLLTNELDLLGKAAASIAKAGEIRNGAESGDPESLEKLDAALKSFKSRFGVQDCALFDAQGMLIASTNDPVSELKSGKTYAARPYFKDSFSGNTGYFFKAGAVHNERIYYVGYPVRSASGKTTGVVVVVKNIHTEPLFQYRFFSIMLTSLLCAITVVFFTVLRRREAFINFMEKIHAQLEEIDRMKTDFISVVSHELRTPLTSIKNAASIMIKFGEENRALDKTELLKIIMNNVDRQTRLVNDLLDVSKIEANAMPVFPEPINVSELINDVIASLKLQADQRNIELLLVAEAPKRMVSADPDHVRRIMNNLLSNAIKFAPQNSRVTVRSEDLGQEIRISVSDNGIGISEEDCKNIFTKFYNSCDVAARKNRGCGLGLAITKGLVEAQKGSIWVDSEYGKGSSFYFTLPFCANE